MCFCIDLSAYPGNLFLNSSFLHLLKPVSIFLPNRLGCNDISMILHHSLEVVEDIIPYN